MRGAPGRGRGAYATFAGRSLIEMAKLRPLDLAALRLVHGVGVILTREAGEEDHVRTRRRRRSAPEPARLDLRSSPPSPEGLADSHIALRGHEGGAAFGGLELEPALEHDDGSGLAVVAG